MWKKLHSKNEFKCNRFFRLKLLDLDYEEIEKLTDGMISEIESIEHNAFVLSWHTRGGATIVDVLNMSTSQLRSLNRMIDKNLETTKKSGLSYF